MTSRNTIRHRKMTEDRVPLIPDPRKKREKKPQKDLYFSFICLVTCVLIFIAFFGFYSDALHPILDNISGHFGYHQKTKQYVIVFDAGSTGTRALAFEFHTGYLDGRLVLDHELFSNQKPGLSSFVNDEAQAVAQIESLLNKAKAVIPQEKWSNTKITLKATAGLRLLGQTQAERLLAVAKQVLDESGCITESVEIMDGTDEGINSWFTVNFLTNRLVGDSTYAALDLGGGSTQVTYAMYSEKTIAEKDLIHQITILNHKINLFSKSYLGLGLMASRYGIMAEGKNVTDIVSDCVNPIIKNREWSYGNVNYKITGKENPRSTKPEVDFDVCYNKARRYIVPLVEPLPTSLQKQEIAAFSYYYDRAIETGLIDAINGGETTIKNFYLQAREACAYPNAEQPFMCLDLTIISVLLEHGFKLRPTTPIKLLKKIDGHEISWALGCGYNILTRGRCSFS